MTNTLSLDKRLTDIGWGVFLVLVGVLWLVPGQVLPRGTWLIAIGALFLVLNGIRYHKDLCVSGCTTIIGALALLAGVGELLGMNVPIFAIALIAIGAVLLIRPLVPQRA